MARIARAYEISMFYARNFLEFYLPLIYTEDWRTLVGIPDDRHTRSESRVRFEATLQNVIARFQKKSARDVTLYLEGSPLLWIQNELMLDYERFGRRVVNYFARKPPTRENFIHMCVVLSQILFSLFLVMPREGDPLRLAIESVEVFTFRLVMHGRFCGSPWRYWEIVERKPKPRKKVQICVEGTKAIKW